MKKNFLARKGIFNITKFTTLDYKDHLSCILWFAKCNMRCPYCYNSDIVLAEGAISNEEVLTFLKSRIGKLDAVVLSGGECTLNSDIIELCEEIKELGFKIKMDTNGLEYSVIEELIDFKLIDYIALDYKAPAYKFKELTKTQSSEKFFKTLDMILYKKFPFEVRTTVHPNLLNEADLNTIILDLEERKYTGTYYLQNYLHVDNTIGSTSAPTKILDKNLLTNSSIQIEFRN